MREAILEALNGVHPLVKVAIVSAMPIFEVRLGIPLGIHWGVPLQQLLPVAIAANVLIVVPVLLWFNPVADWLMSRGIMIGLIQRLLARARSKKPMVEKYGVFAVTLFVAVPLPVTGAWTGALVASVFNMDFWRALACMLLGVMIASAIVLILVKFSVWGYGALAGVG